MKGRMFVVDSVSLEITQNSNIASIRTPVPQNTHWLKTLADIMADMLQIEIGDYIFLWETSSSSNRKSRIHGIYRATSRPYYECTSKDDNAPFKIHIEEAYHFKNPLDEYEVLNCPYIRGDMWTITGKKVAGKSRGTSPLSPKEVEHLITLFIGKNPNYIFYEPNQIVTKSTDRFLKIDYSNVGVSKKPNSLSAFHPNDLCYINNGNVRYEKILETILNQEMAVKNNALFSQIGINVNKVIWHSNYLPYSIEQSEMDYVVFQSDDGSHLSKIFVIELQKGKIDEAHIQRCILYSKWVNETLAIGANVAQPILICFDSYDFCNSDKLIAKNQTARERLEIAIKSSVQKHSVKDLQVYEYSFNPNLHFTRKR